MTEPKIDLLSLWEEVFEMEQEKAALYGERVIRKNPYSIGSTESDEDQADKLQSARAQ